MDSHSFSNENLSQIALVIVIVSLVLIAAVWKTFSKSGRPGGGCIIPIYNAVMWLNIAEKPGWWLLLFLIPGVNLVLWLLVWIDFGRAYGRSTLFGLGLASILLTLPLLLILGFSRVEYVGPAGVHSPASVRNPPAPDWIRASAEQQQLRKGRPAVSVPLGSYPPRVGDILQGQAAPVSARPPSQPARPPSTAQRLVYPPPAAAYPPPTAYPPAAPMPGMSLPPTPTPSPLAATPSQSRDPLVNRQIGQYYIQQRLQSGGMAIVYKAYDQQRKLLVAFKVLRENFLDQPQIVLRFRREAEIARQLTHPHIVPFYDFGEQDGTLYMVMKFMEIGSLNDRLNHTANVTLGKVARWLRQVSGALDFAHSKGIIHRDLKPGNILLANDDDAYLSDFGIARINEATQLTMTGQSMPGTARYMSPEQAMGDPRLDYRSDLYSFAVIAYLLSTGRYPFTGATEHVVINQHITKLPPRPSEVNTGLPPALDTVLLRCLAKDPAHRPNSATQFMNEFERAIAGYEDLMIIVDPNAANPISSTDAARQPLAPTPTPSPVAARPPQATATPAGFDTHTAITQFYQACETANWPRAQVLLGQIRDSGQSPKVFNVARAEQMLREVSKTPAQIAEAEKEYAIVRVMAEHESPPMVWAALQTLWERFPGYDPDRLAERFTPK